MLKFRFLSPIERSPATHCNDIIASLAHNAPFTACPFHHIKQNISTYAFINLVMKLDCRNVTALLTGHLILQFAFLSTCLFVVTPPLPRDGDTT